MVVNVGLEGNGVSRMRLMPRGNNIARGISQDNRGLVTRLAESNHLVAKYSADLAAAMETLKTANSEIDRLLDEVLRLNGEVSSLKEELMKEREKGAQRQQAKQPKQQPKKKESASPDPL